MVAVLIAGFTMFALTQFLICWWRATITQTASRPCSDRVAAVAQHCGITFSSEDFGALQTLLDTCPELEGNKESLGSVRLYYGLVAALRKVFTRIVPPLAAWASNEMATCSRYAAVIVDQRMARNQALMAAMRSI